jgi:leucyl-tRNA synthetase
MGYGTGAIMRSRPRSATSSSPRAFSLPIVPVVAPSDAWLAAAGLDDAARADADGWTEAYTGPGVAIGSANADVSLDGLATEEAKARATAWLERVGAGAGTTSWKLRDWLFSRQRYWGEPFPIVFDEDDLPLAVPESELPIVLPEIDDYAPVVRGDDDESVPEPPLGRATAWREVVLDLGDGPRTYRRELNTMPNWAGSCWYYLATSTPPTSGARRPRVERYWMQGGADGSASSGGVDLYVGGVEHAVLHLLYARFWHKVLYDLGHVSTPGAVPAPLQPGATSWPPPTRRARRLRARRRGGADGSGGFTHHGRPVTAVAGKMGKSLKNSVSPQDVYRAYGADTLPALRDGDGPARRRPAVERRDIVGGPPPPPAPVAQPRRRADRGPSHRGFPCARRPPPHAAPHHRRRGRRLRRPPLQHGGGQGDRAEQTPSPRPSAAPAIPRERWRRRWS